MQPYTLLVFPGRSESVVDNISESVTKYIKLPLAALSVIEL
jgi:hypothetical protein